MPSLNTGRTASNLATLMLFFSLSYGVREVSFKRNRAQQKNTMPNKPTTKPAPKPQATEYSQEAWEKNELERILLKGMRVEQLFRDRVNLVIKAIENDMQLKAVIGNSRETCEKILLLAVEKTGAKGLALARARRFIPDPTDLKEAREALLAPKDENGDDLPPKIKERRGENNEMRLFVIETDDNEGGEAEAEAAE